MTVWLSSLCVIEVGSDVVAAQRGLDPAFVQPADALCLAVLAIHRGLPLPRRPWLSAAWS